MGRRYDGLIRRMKNKHEHTNVSRPQRITGTRKINHDTHESLMLQTESSAVQKIITIFFLGFSIRFVAKHPYIISVWRDVITNTHTQKMSY